MGRALHPLLAVDSSDRKSGQLRRGYPHPMALAVLLVTLGLALAPSPVFGSTAPGTGPSVTSAGEASTPAARVPHASIANGGLALAVDADGADDGHCGWGEGWWDDGWWIVMPIMMVLFWGTVIGVVIWGITQATRRDRGDSRRALDIAQERYARGEISREEFEQIRRDLR